MKNVLIGFGILATLMSSCKKGGAFSGGGMYGVPPSFYFIIGDNNGQSLLKSTTDEIAVSYYLNGQYISPTEHYRPSKTLKGAPTEYIIADGLMAQKSEDGVKTFYLTFQGKTDTLGLDIRQVQATPDNGGNSTPVVTFNGRAVLSSPGNADFPDYYVLKRR